MQNKLITIIIIFLVMAAAIIAWYFYFRTPPTAFAPATAPALEQQSVQPGEEGTLSAGDTTADITKDLDQTFDESAVNDELNSLDQNLQNF